MSLKGHPKHGAKFRTARGWEAGVGGAPSARRCRARVIHTIATYRGATVAAEASFIESRELTLTFIRLGLSYESGGNKYLRQVMIIYTDRERGCDRDDYWHLLPRLQAIASGPLHRCLEMESFPGGEVSKISAPLRGLRRKCPPRGCRDQPGPLGK